MKLRKLAACATLAVASFACVEFALAQNFPTKSIDNVVFSSPGGGTDLVNRQMAAVIQKPIGQQMIVSDMPGGLGGTGGRICLGARP